MTLLQIISLKLKHRLKYSKKATFCFFYPRGKLSELEHLAQITAGWQICTVSQEYTYKRSVLTATERKMTNSTGMDTSDCPCSPLTHNSIHKTCFCTFNVQKVNCPSPCLHMIDGAPLFHVKNILTFPSDPSLFKFLPKEKQVQVLIPVRSHE